MLAYCFFLRSWLLPCDKPGCRLSPALALVCVMLTCPVQADTVWMKNGDRLSGRIQQLEAGKLTLTSSYGGTIHLDWEQVESFESSSVVSIPDEQMQVQYLARIKKMGKPEQVALPIAGVAAESIAPEPDARPPSFWHSMAGKGSLDLGLDQKTASSRTQDYTAVLASKWRHGDWRHTLDAQYTRKTDNRITTSHSYGGKFSSNRFVSDQFFWQGRALYKRDHIEEVSRQAAIGAGPGYQFWEDETGAFSLAGLIGPARHEYNDGAFENFFAASLRWDYSRYLGGERLELYSTGEVMQPLNDTAGTSIDAIVGLRYRMTDWSSWFVNYSRNQISGGRQNMSEKRISTGLGLNW